MPHPLEEPGNPTPRKIATGLARIGVAIKTRAWREAGPEGVTPTQGQILALLRAREPAALSLAQVADEIGTSAPTASVAVETLADKGLVRKAPAPHDARSRLLSLTARGRRAADRVSGWSDALVAGIDALDNDEQAVFLRGVVKIIRTLQERGEIAPARTCATCRFFRPHVHDDPRAPHHCDFVDAPFGDTHLRLDCAEHELAPKGQQATAWTHFAKTRKAPHPRGQRRQR